MRTEKSVLPIVLACMYYLVIVPSGLGYGASGCMSSTPVPRYTVKDLGSYPSELGTMPTSLNDDGTVCGYARNEPTEDTGFR